MILDDYVKIKINKHNYFRYEKLGYNTNNIDEIKLKISDLSKSSKVKIKVKCDVCGKEKEIKYYLYLENTNNFTEEYCCSKKCANDKCKRRLNEKYGVDNIFQLESIKSKSKQTKIEKYSDPNYINLEKRKLTNINKYGVDEHLKSPLIRNKIKSTCIERYGVDCITKVKEIKDEQHKKSLLTKFNKSKDYYNKYNIKILRNKKDSYVIECSKNHIFDITKDLLKTRIQHNVTICTICNPIGNFFISDGEIQLMEYLKELSNKNIIKTEKKLIYPYHIDILLDEYKVGFEYNGVYWHSLREKNYHYNKSKMCMDKGYKLFHIWEDDWKYRSNIVKFKISSYLSKKEIIEDYDILKIDDKDFINRFIDDNSLELDFKLNNKKSFGIKYNDDIISLLLENDDFCLIENKIGYNIDSVKMFKDLINRPLFINNDYDSIDKYSYKNYEFNIKRYCRIYNNKKHYYYNSGIYKLKIE
jgi:hypothetical protein